MSRTESSPMYRDLAVYYDRIYSKKPYRAQTAVLVRLARRFGRSGGRRWLDVACGTGRHLEYLRREFEVTGVDLSGTMLRLARRRLPGVRLVRADMRSFALGERFDVVSCLFSAIGYLRNEREIRQAFRAFASHLLPGGVLLIEPWIAPGQVPPRPREPRRVPGRDHEDRAGGNGPPPGDDLPDRVRLSPRRGGAGVPPRPRGGGPPARAVPETAAPARGDGPLRPMGGSRPQVPRGARGGTDPIALRGRFELPRRNRHQLSRLAPYRARLPQQGGDRARRE